MFYSFVIHVFAAEGRFGNTGNMMIRPNARTSKMMADWMEFGLSRRSKDKEVFRGDMHDQDGIGHLEKLNNTSWAACITHESCTGTHYTCIRYILGPTARSDGAPASLANIIRASTLTSVPFLGHTVPSSPTMSLGRSHSLLSYNYAPQLSLFVCVHSDVKALSKAALRRHRWHFCPQDSGHVMSPYGKDLCGPDYAYIHMVCGCVKKGTAKMLNLWFVEEEAKSKLDKRARWDEVIVKKELHMGANFTLPCTGTGGGSNVSIARWLSGART